MRTFNFCLGKMPPAYDGIWSTAIVTRPKYITDVVRVRSGRLYVAEIPPCTIPSHCEGEYVDPDRKNWAVPAIYERKRNSWRSLTRGCSWHDGNMWENSTHFAFTYEGGKLHVRFDNKSYRLRWRRTTLAEIDTLIRVSLNFG